MDKIVSKFSSYVPRGAKPKCDLHEHMSIQSGVLAIDMFRDQFPDPSAVTLADALSWAEGEMSRYLAAHAQDRECRGVLRTDGAVPYGWDRDGDRLVPNPTEQSVIEYMRRWRAAGVNDNQIAARLNENDMLGKRGGRWQANTVFGVLRTADQMPDQAV